MPIYHHDQLIPEDASEDYSGTHEELNPVMQMLEDHTGLVHSESMDMSNDPRFFQGSVLNKRLAAFSSLSVVSGLMTGTATAVISMKKDMGLFTMDGLLEMVSFAIMTFVLMANIVATYVGVAQVYHAYRLETAGPTGFEMATSYYLNPNIVSWRHVAIKGMLHSLPLFLVSTGLRICINFDRAAQGDQATPPTLWEARLFGLFFMAVYAGMGVLVWYIHHKHMAVFRERYAVARSREVGYLKHVQGMMTSMSSNRLSKGRTNLDV